MPRQNLNDHYLTDECLAYMKLAAQEIVRHHNDGTGHCECCNAQMPCPAQLSADLALA